MMDQPATRAVEHFVHAGYPLDAEAVLLCRSRRHARRGRRRDGARSRACSEAAARPKFAVSQGRGAAAAVLVGPQGGVSGRRAASRPTTTASTARYRARRWRRCSRASRSCRAQFGLRCANVFHAGDGNLHPLILFDANVAGRGRSAPRRSAPRSSSSASRSAARSPASTASGVEKLPQMCVQFAPRASSSAFTAIKRAFDAEWPAQSRQGRADAASLRRVRQDARPSRQAPASRTIPRF